MSKKGNYLFSSLNLWIMVDTVNLLMFGCTLCPAFLVLIPRTRTWSITVALISSDITILCLRWPPHTPLAHHYALQWKCGGKSCLNRWKVLMVLPKEWFIQSVGSGNLAFGSDNRHIDQKIYQISWGPIWDLIYPFISSLLAIIGA